MSQREIASPAEQLAALKKDSPRTPKEQEAAMRGLLSMSAQATQALDDATRLDRLLNDLMTSITEGRRILDDLDRTVTIFKRGAKRT